MFRHICRLKKSIMNISLKKTIKLLTFWFLITFITLQNVVAQCDVSNHKASEANTTYEDFKITTWNVEWLSCLTNGPSNRELQINNVVSMIKTMNSDLVAMQEVGTSNLYTTIDTLVRRLGSEWEGVVVPWNANNCSQNQGIIYKKTRIFIVNAILIKNGGTAYNWSSGRFPVLFEVNLMINKQEIPVSFINIHAKAYSDVTSYARRRDAAIGLKNLLDGSAYNAKRLVILGDFNDYLEGTTCNKCDGVSPYKIFMDDFYNYNGITKNIRTIDHIIISNELFDNYVDNSAFRELSATQTIPNYSSTTSDHIPISITFRFTDDLSITDLPHFAPFYIYPNPTNGELRIACRDALQCVSTNVEIFDIYGRKVGGKFHSNSLEGWNISHLTAGIYFLRINDRTVKIVKN